MSDRFRIQRIEVSGALLTGFEDYTIDEGRTHESLTQDGSVHEQAHIVPEVRPVIDITGCNLQAIAAWNGSTLLPLVIPSGAGLRLWGARQAKGAPGLEATNHKRHTVALSTMFLAGLAWSQGQRGGLATVRCLPKGANGLTDPIVREDTGTLPAADPNPTTHAWRPTAIVVGGSALSSFASVTQTFDPQLEQDHASGAPYPTEIHGSGAPFAAMLEVETHDIRAGVGAGACSIVWRQLAHGGGFATGANTVLTFTYNGGWAWNERESGGQGSTRRANLVVRTRIDGVNMPVSWALSSGS